VESVSASSGPRSWAEHIESAQQHEQKAAEQEELSREYESKFFSEPHSWVCCDTVIQDQVTTGGQPVTYSQPWYNVHVEPWWRHHRIAVAERAAARAERQAAGDLQRRTLAACAGIPESERDQSLWSRPDAVAEVIPHRVSGRLRGVTMILRPNALLTADRVRRDLECRQALWAMHGERPDEAGADPTLVFGADIDVHQSGPQVVVIVTTPNDEAAQVALARARTTAAPEQTAQR
jgi:hypothetical protein